MQNAGFDLIYADTDAVFLKKKDATRNDFEKIMDELIRETGLQMTLEFHYKFLVLLYIEADEKMEAKKRYFGLTYNNQLITRGIDTRRHDSPVFMKEFPYIYSPTVRRIRYLQQSLPQLPSSTHFST